MSVEPTRNKPQELLDLEAQIAKLQARRDELNRQWLDSIAPFKVGETVIVTKGKAKRRGVVEWQKWRYGSDWDYGVRVELKKGGTEMQHVYSWEKLERANER